MSKINVWDAVEVEVKFAAKEYNSKYYNSLRGWKISKLDKGGLDFGGWKEEDFWSSDLPF